LSVSRSGHDNVAVRPTQLVTSATLAAVAATPAAAHGFGERYELPLPLELYVYGAAAVVALSFLAFGLFVHRAPAPRERSPKNLLTHPVGRLLSHWTVVLGMRLAALALFLVVIVAGFLGDQNPYRNIVPTLVWIIWWVGFAFLSAFIGNVWALVNPWTTAFDGVHLALRRLGWEGAAEPVLRYPGALGVWPASIFLLAFAWVELIDPNAASPAHIAKLAIAYSILTWAGMALFGRDIWLKHCEVFSLFFGTFARFSPLEVKKGRVLVRPFGSGLVESPTVSTSMVAFTLLLLATVLYDGLIGTGEWALFESALQAHAHDIGKTLIRTVGLVAFWALFLCVYLGISAIASWTVSGAPSTLEIARSFALTLVPIAIGYHVAHYLVFLLVQGQYAIPLISDPLGRGWDLFGTAGYRVDIGLIGARFAWYLALGAIVGGHVIAVYLAHIRAISIISRPRSALVTQVPMTAVMVLYTFIGLSIAAEPIVESRAGAEPIADASARIAIPSDAVLPASKSGLLNPVGPGQEAALKLTYRMLGSAFHDGTKTSPADLLYAYAFAYRWGTRSGDGDMEYDPYIDAATAALRRDLKGVRITGSDTTSKSLRVGDVDFVREVFTVEVYLATSGETEISALIAPPWTTLPWTVLALMEEAVGRGWAAFSEAEATRRKIPQLDLVRSTALTSKLASLLDQLEIQGFRPPALRALVTEEEARRRWESLSAFFKANGHFLVTNGPYKLRSWGPDHVTLEAFRDLSYPLGVGSFDAFAVPRRGYITAADWNGRRLIVSGDIEVIERYQRSYRLIRTPLKSVPRPTLLRSAPECRYFVTGPDGRVLAAGKVEASADAACLIDLGDRLPPGRYTLEALLAVNGNTMNADIKRFDLVIPPNQQGVD